MGLLSNIGLDNFFRDKGLKTVLFEIVVPLVLFIAGILFMMPEDIGSKSIELSYYAYAIFVFLIVWNAARSLGTDKNNKVNPKFFLYLMVFSIVFLIITRLLPFFQYGEAPLGYDTGFYIKGIDDVMQGLEGSRFARGLIWIPLSWIGVPSGFILHGLYILTQLLIAGSIYMLARSMTKKDYVPYVSVALFLFSVSLPQFFAYWWMYYQTMVGIAFLIMTLALFHRRSPLALVTAGFGAAIHSPTFFGFVIAFAIFLVVRPIYSLIRYKTVEKDIKYMAIFSLASLVSGWILLRLIDPGTIYSYLRGINEFGWFVTNYPAHLIEQTRGLFIDFDVFKLSTIYLIPFVVSGVLLFGFKKIPELTGGRRVHVVFLFLLLAVLIILSTFPFVYQHRHLIYLDLTFILFGAYALLYFLKYFLNINYGKIMVVLLLSGFVFFNINVVLNQQPQLSSEELSEIKALAYVVDQDSMVMATDSLYTPWVYAYSGHSAIGPGYLQDKWTYQMWEEFWSNGNDARRRDLLNVYNKPVYIFVGQWIMSDTAPYVDFLESDKNSTRVSEHVWRYDPYEEAVNGY
jgi:hypothetical protein